MDVGDDDEQPAKIRKLPLSDDSMAAIPADTFNLGGLCFKAPQDWGYRVI